MKGLLNKVPRYRLWFPLENQGTWGERFEFYSFNEGYPISKTGNGFRVWNSQCSFDYYSKMGEMSCLALLKDQWPSHPLIIFAVLSIFFFCLT